MREIIKEARNVEEAIELACQELQVERDTIDFEIISLPKRGFLGLRHTPAKVRVSVIEPEVPAPKEPPCSVQRPAVQQQKASAPRPSPAPMVARTPVKPKSAPVQTPVQTPVQAPVQAPKTQTEAKTAGFPKPAAQAAVQTNFQASSPRPVAESATPSAPMIFVSAETVDGKAKIAADYLREVLRAMGVEATINVAFTENGIVLRLSGEGLGVIIGRRGETLDALQYLSGLVANRQEGDYIRVTIDSGNYREKRERTLEQLAQKLSASAIRYGRASTLEPMNPYERRIIHATVSKIEGVSSTSVGEEPNRRVVITPVNLKPQNRAPRPAGNRRPPFEGNRPPRRPDKPMEAIATEQSENEMTPHPTFKSAPARPEPRRDFRQNDRGPQRDRPPFYHAATGEQPAFNRAPHPESIKPTPTAVDHAYALELEKNPPVFTKHASEKTDTAPARPQTKEADDLPLYGKIEL